MDQPDHSQPKEDGPIERAMSAATWIVAILALLIVAGLVAFFIFDLGPAGDEDAFGSLAGLAA